MVWSILIDGDFSLALSGNPKTFGKDKIEIDLGKLIFFNPCCFVSLRFF